MRKCPPQERFWPKVDTSGECWLWMGGKTKVGGYGRIVVAGRTQILAHRLSYEMAYGPIPEGMQVDHICFNKSCVRPEHLRLATYKENREYLAGAQANSKSGIRGVMKEGNVWRVQVRHNKKLINGGSYRSIVEAEAAAIALRNRLFTRNDVDRREIA